MTGDTIPTNLYTFKKRRKVMNFKKVMVTGLSSICIASAPLAAVLPATTVVAATTAPSSADKATILVSGVEEGATVQAYQMIVADYNQYGLIGYHLSDWAKATLKTYFDENNIAYTGDADGYPTYKEVVDAENGTVYDYVVEALSRYLYSSSNNQTALTLSRRSNGTYRTTAAKAGSYIVIVRKSDATYVYNPMIVSNAYTDANDASTLGKQTTNGSVDVTADNAMLTVKSNNHVYAKKSDTTLDKKIKAASSGKDDAEDVAVGDTVTFEIRNTTPDYSDAFTNITYRISDKQDKSLSVPTSDIKVYVETTTSSGVKETALNSEYYTVTKNVTLDGGATKNDFYVDFNSDWLKANPVTKVLVRYSATITKDADLAVLPNINRAELDYSTLPTDETGHLYDWVHLYTFKIDEFVKVDEDGTVQVVKKDSNKHEVVSAEDALEGATFQLTRLTDRAGNTTYVNAEGTTRNYSDDYVYTCTTADDGIIEFKGLDEGTYRLVETDAPDGFFLTDDTFTVTISAEYEGDADNVALGVDEWLKSYTVSIVNDNDANDKATSTYAPTYKDGEVTGTKELVTAEGNVTIEKEIQGFGIHNIELSKLPSTGAIGRIVLTVVGSIGACVMGVALFLTGKRRKVKAE